MNNGDGFNTKFLNTLLIIRKSDNNPFKTYRNNYLKKFSEFTSIFGFYEDNIEEEVRCPICLGKTKSTTKPSNCDHLFCSFCIKKWFKNSNKCPVCRAQFYSLIRVDIAS